MAPRWGCASAPASRSCGRGIPRSAASAAAASTTPSTSSARTARRSSRRTAPSTSPATSRRRRPASSRARRPRTASSSPASCRTRSRSRRRSRSPRTRSTSRSRPSTPGSTRSSACITERGRRRPQERPRRRRRGRVPPHRRRGRRWADRGGRGRGVRRGGGRLHALRRRPGHRQRAQPLERELVPGPLRQPAARAVDALLLPGLREPGADGSRDLRADAARGHGDDAVARAYRDLGLRAVIVIGMSDRSYDEVVVLDLGLVPEELRRRFLAEKPPGWPEWEAFSRFAVERYHRPDEGISIGLGPSGPQRCTDDMLQACAALADELDLTIHIHVLETRMQALSGRRMYGKTLPAHMNELGFLGPRVSFEHGIWLTDADVDLVASTGTSITHNPISNLKLGSGIAAVPVLLDAGVNVAMGSDGMSSNDGNDLYATLKVAGLLHKLWDLDYERWLGAREAWRMATRGGAQAAGDDGLGLIEPGRRADLVLLDLESRVFTPLNDPLQHVVFSSTTSAVRSTMVGGRWVLRDGQVTGVDEAAILAEGRELGQGVLERHAEAFRLGAELLASVRAGWLEAPRTDVGINRSMPLERR